MTDPFPILAPRRQELGGGWDSCGLRLVAARATQRKATDENEAESEEREGVVLGEDVGAVGEGVGVHELEDAVGKSG